MPLAVVDAVADKRNIQPMNCCKRFLETLWLQEGVRTLAIGRQIMNEERAVCKGAPHPHRQMILRSVCRRVVVTAYGAVAKQSNRAGHINGRCGGARFIAVGSRRPLSRMSLIGIRLFLGVLQVFHRYWL